MNEIDENLNNAVIDFAIASPFMLVACLHRAFAAPRVTVENAAVSSPSPARSKCLPSPMDRYPQLRLDRIEGSS
eukprot:5510993-Pleurochrysis_carterae.AAC.1